GGLAGGVGGGGAMLKVDEQPIEAGGLHRLGDFDGAGEFDADAERQLSALEPLARGIANRLHESSPLSLRAKAFSPREGGGKQSRATRTAPSALDCFVASLLAMTIAQLSAREGCRRPARANAASARCRSSGRT